MPAEPAATQSAAGPIPRSDDPPPEPQEVPRRVVRLRQLIGRMRRRGPAGGGLSPWPLPPLGRLRHDHGTKGPHASGHRAGGASGLTATIAISPVGLLVRCGYLEKLRLMTFVYNIHSNY